MDQTPKSQRKTAAYLLQRNWALLAVGDLPEAQKGIAQGLAIERTPEFLLQDAILKTSRKDYAGARLAQEEALRQDPEDVRVVNGILRLYVTQNQIPSALQKLRVYAARRPRSAAAQNLLGTWLLERGDLAGARTAFAASKAADPKFTSAEVSLAKLDLAEGKLDSARHILENLEASGVRDPEIPLHLGFLETTTGAQTEAIRQFQSALEMDPENIVALNNLAYLLAGSPRHADEALAYAQKVKELSPENPSVDDTIGWVLYQKGAYAAALTHFEAAVKATDDPVVRYHLAMAYVKLGDSKGPQMLAACIKAAPSLPEAKMAKELLAGIKPSLKAAR
jgi:tetratricopeptide (TPR) repeat protein